MLENYKNYFVKYNDNTKVVHTHIKGHIKCQNSQLTGSLLLSAITIKEMLYARK